MKTKRSLAKFVLGALLAFFAIGAVLAAVSYVQERRRVAEDTADEIQAKLDSLDPVTRAAVRARLTADVARNMTKVVRRRPG